MRADWPQGVTDFDMKYQQAQPTFSSGDSEGGERVTTANAPALHVSCEDMGLPMTCSNKHRTPLKQLPNITVHCALSHLSHPEFLFYQSYPTSHRAAGPLPLLLALH